MIAGCLQKKNGYYYAVLYTYVGEDKKTRKNKWIPLKLPVEGTSPRKAQKAFDEARINYEKELEEQLAEQEMRKQ